MEWSEKGSMSKLRLVVFDVDGTLLKIRSSWQHLHEALGTWDRGKQYAEQFFQGLIGYEEWRSWMLLFGGVNRWRKSSG